MKSERPRVLHVVISLAHGGLERLVLDWTHARNALSPGSTAICCLDPAQDSAFDPGEIPTVCLNAERGKWPWDFRAVRALHRYVRTNGINILHSHNLAAQQYSALASIGTAVGHVHTDHASTSWGGGLIGWLRERVLNSLTDCTVAVSDATAHGARWRKQKPRVVVNGVSEHQAMSDRCREEETLVLGLPEGGDVIGSIGRLSHIKGQDRLIHAFRDMLSRRATRTACPVTLLLVGDGPTRDELMGLASELGVESHIRFAGYRDSPRGLLDMIDLFVLPSRSEGLSVSLLEAMAAGCHVAVTDVGENRGVVEGGLAGALLPDDEREWGKILDELLTSRSTPERIAEVARAGRRVKAMYSLSQTVSEYEAVYSEVRLARRARPTRADQD